MSNIFIALPTPSATYKKVLYQVKLLNFNLSTFFFYFSFYYTKYEREIIF